MGLRPQPLQLPHGLPRQVCPDSRDPSLWLLDRRQHHLFDANGRITALGRTLQAWLSPGELHRWRQLRRRDDQERSLLARAGLRVLLGRALQLSPGQVPLAHGPWGKPRLGDAAQGALHFNLSHAGELVLIGLHRHLPLGVDIEPLHGDRPPLQQQELLMIARQLFGAADAQALYQLPRQHQQHDFLKRWCRLEARLKARGTGLQMGLPVCTQTAPIRDITVELPDGYAGHCCLLVQANDVHFLPPDLPQI